MKKRFAFLLCILCLVLLTGCGKNDFGHAEELAVVAEAAEIAVGTTEAVTEAPTEPVPVEETTEAAEETIAPTEEVTEPAAPEGVRGVVYNTDSLNVRKAPGVNNERVARLARGTEVTVYETVKKNGALWGRMDQGWVSMDYIKLDGELPEPGEDPGEPIWEPTEPVWEETEPEEEEHTHSYTEKITEPTCTQNGFTIYTCSCGDGYRDNYVNALGHTWSQWKTTREPTESAEGEAQRICGSCDEKETKTLPKLVPDHTHKYTEKVTQEPSCTADGLKTFTCTCGDKYTERIPQTGHKYTDKVTKPTCTEKGFTTHTCGKCGESYKDTYRNPTGHDYAVTEKKATCTEAGSKTSKCRKCGATTTETIPALGHKWHSWVTEKAPTESNTGLKSRTCSNCSKKETQTIDKLPPTECKHNYTVSFQKDATCTKDGSKTLKCKKCGDTKTETIPATGHSWGDWVTVKEPTESSTGKAERTCSKCAKKESKVLDKLPPKPTNPPETEPPEPTECYHVSNPNFFGKYQKVDPTCTEDGYWLTKCTACGEPGPTKPSWEPATGHKYTITDQKKATCAENGYTKKHCDVCGHTVTETIEGGHNWEWDMWSDPNGYMREYEQCTCGKWKVYPDECTESVNELFRIHVEECHPDWYNYSFGNGIEYWGEPNRYWFECTRCGKIVETQHGDPAPPKFD